MTGPSPAGAAAGAGTGKPAAAPQWRPGMPKHVFRLPSVA